MSDYDVIVAFDADWTTLDVSQLQMLKDWVGTHAGGIIFMAGPVHTFHLARPGGLDINPDVVQVPADRHRGYPGRPSYPPAHHLTDLLDT